MQIVTSAVKTAFAVAAGAGMLLAATATHAVTIVTPVSIAVPATTAGVYVNVVTGAFGTAAFATGWDINLWASAGLGFFTPSNITGGAYVMQTGSTTQVANLSLGSVVPGAATFGSGSSTAANAAQWNLNSSNNYFGFRFVNETGTTTHYGFAQLQIGAAITDRTIIALGYETTPLTAVTVSAVPEPTTYGLMGLGIAGVLLAARRRKQA